MEIDEEGYGLLMQLPDAVLHALMLPLDDQTLLRFSSTCSRLRRLAASDHIWKQRCASRYGISSLIPWRGSCPSLRTFRTLYQKLLHPFRQVQPQTSVSLLTILG